MAVGEAAGRGRGVVDAAIVKNREQQEPPTAKQALSAPGAVVQEEQQDPPVHHSQAEAAAAAVARSEGEPPKFFKPAWQCGTPGATYPTFTRGRTRASKWWGRGSGGGPCVRLLQLRSPRALPLQQSVCARRGRRPLQRRRRRTRLSPKLPLR